MRLEDFDLELRQVPGAMPVWRARVDEEQWRTACRLVRDKGGRLVALWGADHSDRGARYAVHAALTVQSGLLVLVLAVYDGHYPDLSDLFPAASRMQRAVYDLFGIGAANAADQRKWLRHAAWPEDVFPLRKSFDAGAIIPERRGRLSVRAGRRRRRARDPGRTGACRHDRARTLPFLHRGRRRAAHGRAARLQAQRRREALRADGSHRGRAARRAHFVRFDRRLRVGVRDGRGGRDGRDAAAARLVAARAPARARARRAASVGPGLSRQRRGTCFRARAVFAAARRLAAREPRALRPPLSDGHHHSRRRRARHQRYRHCLAAHRDR